MSKFALKISNKNSLGLVLRSASHWNKDWKPSPYPQTQAEREAAAKKYGIPVEQYQPYPDDGTGNGDYPILPDISTERKDPHYPYDYPEMRRNFGDVMHADTDLYSEDRHNNTPQRYSITFMLYCFLGVMTACATLFVFLEDYKMFRPVLPKQYPGKGKVHYTFSPVD